MRMQLHNITDNVSLYEYVDANPRTLTETENKTRFTVVNQRINLIVHVEGFDLETDWMIYITAPLPTQFVIEAIRQTNYYYANNNLAVGHETINFYTVSDALEFIAEQSKENQ